MPTFSGVKADLWRSVFVSPQVLSALDILQPPHIDYFEEMYPKQKANLPGAVKLSDFDPKKFGFPKNVSKIDIKANVIIISGR